jgi:hypothetical protein
MKIGDTMTLKDYKLPEGCEALTSLDTVLVSILHPRGISEATAAAETEAASPEHKAPDDKTA